MFLYHKNVPEMNSNKKNWSLLKQNQKTPVVSVCVEFNTETHNIHKTGAPKPSHAMAPQVAYNLAKDPYHAN